MHRPALLLHPCLTALMSLAGESGSRLPKPKSKPRPTWSMVKPTASSCYWTDSTQGARPRRARDRVHSRRGLGGRRQTRLCRRGPADRQGRLRNVSINYRHAPKFLFPAQVEDSKCAVRWLRGACQRNTRRSAADRRNWRFGRRPSGDDARHDGQVRRTGGPGGMARPVEQSTGRGVALRTDQPGG